VHEEKAKLRGDGDPGADQQYPVTAKTPRAVGR
jgi:hypothetical protein